MRYYWVPAVVLLSHQPLPAMEKKAAIFAHTEVYQWLDGFERAIALAVGCLLTYIDMGLRQKTAR
jgi:hypothetical protein